MKLPLPLRRPLIALDVETHDKCEPEQARIVELGFRAIYPMMCTACRGTGVNVAILTTHHVCDLCGGVGVVIEREARYVSYIKPDLLISEGATAVHGISNDTVNGCRTCNGAHPSSIDNLDNTRCVCEPYDGWPTFKEIAPKLAGGFSNCDFAGYNVRFDLRVLAAEFARAGVEWSQGDAKLLDSMQIWRLGEPRTLTDAVRRFLQREPTEAHRALGDAEDALDVAFAQLALWPQLPRDVNKLHALCFGTDSVDPDGKFRWVNGEVTFSFGKFKGVPLSRAIQMDRKYIQSWMLTKGDFSKDVKRLLVDALNGVYPVQPVVEVSDET